MADAPTSTRLAGPRHLVGGRWRRQAERAAVALVLVPALAAVAVAVVALVLVGALVAVLVLVTFVAAVVCWPFGRRWARRAYWRTRWWWDARAALLALNAEASVTGADTGTVDREHLVVCPFVRRLDIEPGARRYTVRPLPSQTAADFEAAAPRLAQRWAAPTVRVEHTPGARDVVIVVRTGVPRPQRLARR